MAVASLVLGIISFVSLIICCCFPFSVFSGVIFGILAIVFGAIAIYQSKKIGKQEPMAITGFVLGIVSVAISIIMVIVITLGFTFSSILPSDDYEYGEYETISKADLSIK